MLAVMQHNGLFRSISLLAIFSLLALETASAVTEPTADYSIEELEELVGPVALYPDDLIAIILPAASYPLQIVEASRYLEKLEKNPDLKPDDDWDDAVVALLNYPEVIAMLNEDLDWTWNLGEAVVNQQPAVLDAIQNFRGLAVEAGNLKTDKRQTVSQVDEVIEVTPVDPEVIYVPDYQPRQVIVYQSRPVYGYYPTAYPLYYYPYPIQHRFASGFFWGVTTAYTVGWLTDRVQFHYFGQPSHPYFGSHYTSQYYAPHAGRIRHTRSFGSQRHLSNNRARFGNTWKASDRHGDRPRNRRAVANRDHNVASDFRGSTTRQNRSARDHNRNRANGDRRASVRNRVDRNIKRAHSSQTRDQNSSTRRNWRRSDDSARKNTRLARLDPSSNGKSSRRSATTNSRAGSNAFTGTRNTQHNKASTRSTHKPRAGNSERIKRSTARSANTRAPSRQEHRPAVRSTNRSTSKHITNPPPATASRNHSANTTRGAGSTTSHQQSGSHRSGSRGGHSGSRGGHRR